jgi:hypothetical protein
MERSWSNDLSKPLYRKLPGTGGLRLRKPLRRIKPGEKIRITAEELGRFINEFELLEDSPQRQPAELKREEKKDRFVVVSAAPGWFDVIDTLTEKKVNDKKYRQNEAQKYVEDLNAEK